MQALPEDITQLPKYSISIEQFICTSILLILMLIWCLIMMIVWIYRSYHHIHNYEYIVNYNIMRQFQIAKKTVRLAAIQNQSQQMYQLDSSQSSSKTKYDTHIEQSQMVWNRFQSRILEFACLIVVLFININAYLCTLFETIAFLICMLTFLLFNICRILDFRGVRLLFFLPLIVVYLPFYLLKKSLIINS